MSRNRHAARVDDNQNDIVDELLKLDGVTAEKNHDDILVGYNGFTFWFEIKNESVVSKRTHKVIESAKKKSQIRLEKEWTGHYRIVWKLEQILEDIGYK